MNDTDHIPPAQKWAPQFSLLTVLLLMALFACGITIAQLWREVGPLREEVRKLRDEAGVLVVDDPTKVHAIRVDTRDELTWKWRVWIPDNRVYVVRSQGDRIPKEGFPADGGSIWIREPGEHVIGYQIDRDRTNAKWFGKMTVGSSNVGKDEQSWITWPRQTATGGGVSNSARSFEPAQRIELIRHRVSQSGDVSKIEDPSAGFMIWLEPSK